VNGRPQCRFIQPGDASSPTVSLESQITTLVVDAYKKCHVAVFDIPGAYLNSYLPEERYKVTKFKGDFAHIMVQV